jgi:hypothetical protein
MAYHVFYIELVTAALAGLRVGVVSSRGRSGSRSRSDIAVSGSVSVSQALFDIEGRLRLGVEAVPAGLALAWLGFRLNP